MFAPESSATAALWMTLAFVLALCASVLLKVWLASRHIRHVARHRNAVPAAYAEHVSLASHAKAADYTIAKTRFGLAELFWSAALTLGWTLLGGLQWLNEALHGWLAAGLLQQTGLLVAFALMGSLLELPFSLYQTFVLEQRFGFNRTSLGLWLVDGLKSAAVSLALGVPLVALALWIMGSLGATWWWWLWCVWMGFNVLMLLVYPRWIAPWFNRFQPLDDAVLKERVERLMQRCGFTAQGFFVMDGSRRSAHANAYFTGFGASKRVVFFDTLLRQLSPDQVEAVLAHELGHFKLRHVGKRIVGMALLSLLALALLGWLHQRPWFYAGLGVFPAFGGGHDALALALYMLVLPLASSIVGPLLAHWSRAHEFEADAFAAAHTSARDLAGALMTLYRDNAATLTPDPLYVRFYYSHPDASERLARLQAAA